MVIVHSTPSCFQCKMTKRRLDEKGIEYREVDLSQDPVAMERVKSLGYSSAPVVFAGDDHWSGFIPEKIDALAS